MRRAIPLLLAMFSLANAGEFNIVWDGSSSTSASNFPTPVTNLLLGMGHSVHSSYVASSGRSMGLYTAGCDGSWLMACQAPVNVDPVLNAYPGKQILWSQNPTNDMTNDASGEVAYARHLDYIARRSSTWVHVVMTSTPRTNPGYNPRRNVYNDLLRGGCLDRVQVYANAFGGAAFRCGGASPYRYVVDAAADTRIGLDGVELDPVWVPDGVHLSSAGYAIVRDMAVAVLLDSLAPALSGIFPLPGPVRW